MMFAGSIGGRDRWHAREGVTTFPDRLRPGDIITIDYPGYRHKPWVLRDVRKHEQDDRYGIVFRPVGAEFDFAQFNETLGMGRHASVGVLPEHYAVCHKCGEIPPCSEVWTETISDAHAERAARYEVEGICPACSSPISSRQKSIRFEENLYVPLGPPVMFHAKRGCASSAVYYDELVAKTTGREPRLSCGGMHVQHLDGYHECTNITCPGMKVRHRSFAMCYVLSANCNRPECWAIKETR